MDLRSRAALPLALALGTAPTGVARAQQAQPSYSTPALGPNQVAGSVIGVVPMCVTTAGASVGPNVAVICGTYGTAAPSSGSKASSGSLTGTVTANQGPAGSASWLVSDPLLDALIANGALKVSAQGTTAVSGTVALASGSASVGSVAQGAAGTSPWESSIYLGGAAVAAGNPLPVTVGNLPATQPVSGAVTSNAGTGTFAVSAAGLPLPAGAATAAGQVPAAPPGTSAAAAEPIQGVAGGVPVPVSGTVTANAGSGTMAVSAATLPLPAGAASAANQALDGMVSPFTVASGAAVGSAVTVNGGASMSIKGYDAATLTVPASTNGSQLNVAQGPTPTGPWYLLNATSPGSYAGYPSQGVSGSGQQTYFPTSNYIQLQVAGSSPGSAVSGYIELRTIPQMQPTEQPVNVVNTLPYGTNLIGGTSAYLGSNPVSPANPLTVAQSDVRQGAQSLSATATTSAVTVPLANGEGVVGFSVAGLTASGAVLTSEGSSDGGLTWVGVNNTSPGGGAVAQTVAADGTFRVSGAGHTALRLRVSTLGTGTITVGTNAQSESGLVQLIAAEPPRSLAWTDASTTATGAAAVPAGLSATPYRLGIHIWNVGGTATACLNYTGTAALSGSGCAAGSVPIPAGGAYFEDQPGNVSPEAISLVCAGASCPLTIKVR